MPPVNLDKVKNFTKVVGQRQRKGRVNGGSERFDHNGHVIEENFGPKSLVVAIIPIRSCDLPDLKYIILDGNLVPIHIIAALEVSKLIQAQGSELVMEDL